MNNTNDGSKIYLYSITTVAILGGLLFGYDTAVISGAEKGLEAFFLMAPDFHYDKVMHGITSSSALIGCVIGGALSGIFASRMGRRNSLRLAAILFFLSALGTFHPEFLFFLIKALISRYWSCGFPYFQDLECSCPSIAPWT